VEVDVVWELASLCNFRPASLGGGFGGIVTSDTVSAWIESFISATSKPSWVPSFCSRHHFLDMLSPTPPYFSLSLSLSEASNGRNSARTQTSLLPQGELVNFHDTMDSIGNLLSARTLGQWEMIINAFSSHFSTKDKDSLVNMMEAMSQFFKATKTRKKKNDQK
jgi:hypothetical protein